MKIWIDNDACPQVIKDIIFKASERLAIKVVLVANRSMVPPKTKFAEVVTVPKGADIADQHIIDQVAPLDIVITSDIPLADAVVAKNASAINPRGEIYTATNIKEIRAMRDLMTDLRNDRVISGGGPQAFGAKQRELFANALDRTLTKNCNALNAQL